MPMRAALPGSVFETCLLVDKCLVFGVWARQNVYWRRRAAVPPIDICPPQTPLRPTGQWTFVHRTVKSSSCVEATLCTVQTSGTQRSAYCITCSCRLPGSRPTQHPHNMAEQPKGPIYKFAVRIPPGDAPPNMTRPSPHTGKRKHDDKVHAHPIVIEAADEDEDEQQQAGGAVAQPADKPAKTGTVKPNGAPKPAAAGGPERLNPLACAALGVHGGEPASMRTINLLTCATLRLHGGAPASLRAND